MSELINAIKHCVSPEGQCKDCPFKDKNNYFCGNLLSMGDDFAEELVNEHDNLVAEVERLKQELINLRSNYVNVKLTEEYKKRMDKCASGQDENCCSCICNVCIMTYESEAKS